MAGSRVICSHHNKIMHINKCIISLIKGKEAHKRVDETQASYTLRKGSQAQKSTHCMILFVWHSGKGKPIRREHSSGAARGWW